MVKAASPPHTRFRNCVNPCTHPNFIPGETSSLAQNCSLSVGTELGRGVAVGWYQSVGTVKRDEATTNSTENMDSQFSGLSRKDGNWKK